MINLKNSASLIFATALLISCSGNQESDNVEDASMVESAKDTTAYTVDDTTKFKFDFAIANIRSPAGTLQELIKWGVTYDNRMLNNPKNSGNYTTEYQRSFNLGIYNIDMAYAMANGKGAEVLQYMKSILELSDGLGLKGAVDMMVGKRAETNLNNRDSLFKILDEIFVKSDAYLRTNERVYTASNIFAGAWLESLYLNCKIGEEVQDPTFREAAHKHLWDQRFYLGNLIQLLSDYRNKKECAELIAKLKPIHDEITAIKDPKNFSENDFKSISSKIYLLRNSFIM